jgi:hypothetical protein
MQLAEQNSSEFLTGKPIRVIRYGVGEDDKTTFCTFCTFETERGIEETFSARFECLADAIESTTKQIRLNP